MSTFLDPKVVERLRASFPDDAIQEATIMGFTQTGIRPQFVIERLNEAFGHLGWNYEVLQAKIEGDFAGAYVKLNILDENQKVCASREQWGGARVVKSNWPDAQKGAITNAIGKCASWFDIAHEAYKGELEFVDEDQPVKTKYIPSYKSKPVEAKSNQVNLSETKPQTTASVPPTVSRDFLLKKLSTLQTTYKLGDNDVISIAKEVTGMANLNTISVVSNPVLQRVIQAIEKKNVEK